MNLLKRVLSFYSLLLSNVRKYGAILSFLLVFSSPSIAADDCAPEKISVWAKATYALSGDSVIIQNKTFQLIGVRAPQREKKQKFSTRGQPLAKAAQEQLNRLLANHDLDIGVEYDNKKVDGFNRGQLHLFVKQDGSIVNLNKLMLESGYALAETSPPNLKHQTCYYQAEAKARAEKKGLWRLTDEYPNVNYPIAPSDKITTDDDGYRIYQGKILKVDRSSKQYILNMDTTGIRIKKAFWPRFDYDKLAALEGKTIEVRGRGAMWKGHMFVWIESPNAINVLNPALQTP